MRLIDADALKTEFSTHGILRALPEKLIVEAPTIDPVKHGRWVEKYIDQWYCSECGRPINVDEYDDRNDHLYCRYCGTKMYKEVSD